MLAEAGIGGGAIDELSRKKNPDSLKCLILERGAAGLDLTGLANLKGLRILRIAAMEDDKTTGLPPKFPDFSVFKSLEGLEICGVSGDCYGILSKKLREQKIEFKAISSKYNASSFVDWE